MACWSRGGKINSHGLAGILSLARELLKAYEILVEAVGPDGRHTQLVVPDLVELYRVTGDEENAEAWQAMRNTSLIRAQEQLHMNLRRNSLSKLLYWQYRPTANCRVLQLPERGPS